MIKSVTIASNELLDVVHSGEATDKDKILRAQDAHLACEILDANSAIIELIVVGSNVPWWDGVSGPTPGCVRILDHLRSSFIKVTKKPKIVVMCQEKCGKCEYVSVSEEEGRALINQFREQRSLA